MDSFLGFASRVLQAARKKGIRYWLFALVFGLIGGWSSYRLDDAGAWFDLKHKTYLYLQNLRGGMRRVPQTTLISIGDAEYYGDELAGRRPLKRSYLARLIRKTAEARPAVIALDIDLRSADPTGAREDPADYRNETEELMSAVCSVNAAHTKIVLSKAISEVKGNLLGDHNVYDDSHSCPAAGHQYISGYIQLANDIRRVPLTVTLNDGTQVDSFSLAIARAAHGRQFDLQQLDREDIPFGYFHSPGEFRRPRLQKC